MPRRIANRLKFQLERLILRGAHYRLLVIAALLGLLSLVAGMLVYAYTGVFARPGEAIWWAFLRLTDPGYLGDDEGVFLRVVSTALTVLGFVIFVGALIAILTQWLNQTIRDLESGYTPVALRNHVVILGWTNRTASIVRELILSQGRLKRFLHRHGARGLRVAILAEEVRPALVQELRERLGQLWNARQVVLRSGSALRLEHLRRVDFTRAAAVLLPATDFQHGGTATDTRVIKTLLSMANHPAARERELPLVVAEIQDARKIRVARGAYRGRIELLASDSIISRLIAQNVRHRGLSHVFGEILTHGRGNEIYIRECPRFAGVPLHDLSPAFPRAVVLGVARPHGSSFSPVLNPPAGWLVEPGDRLVLLARSYAETEPGAAAPAPGERGAGGAGEEAPPPERRVLLLGWSHRVPALLREFDSYAGERFRIDVLSALPAAERERYVDRYGARPRRITLSQVEGDYTAPAELRRAEPWTYDNVVLLGSDWLESGEESDARTILGYLLLREMVPEEGGPEVLVELLDPENHSLFRRRPGEVLISPLILSHMLAQVALRPELRAVFDELFGPGGAEISFVPAGRYGAAGRELHFRELERRVALRGETALGVRLAPAEGDRGGLRLNPSREQRWMLTERDEVVVLTTYA